MPRTSRTHADARVSRRHRGSHGHWIIVANSEDGPFFAIRGPGPAHAWHWTSELREAHRFGSGSVAQKFARRMKEQERRQRGDHEQFLFNIHARLVRSSVSTATRTTRGRRPRPKQRMEREWRELHEWRSPGSARPRRSKRS